ncbi:hypothetical protein PSEUBRA_005118 [Kalmanozyma brasiliensis GHG001]|uniref:uncharacterized protein n=1 Tax=Kalmanozyma brasiliensis (strain GHG001) TaxID=1365824 RepID=UPI0028681429|nr:uncharacterized protein PSEUBRA_005118 [Kalmanozyma brasiliensis GHG001]KAF6767480.1 hypothetical protein PSEUBRA_005118 [Kalmanozyma brasiliensis GHG001]
MSAPAQTPSSARDEAVEIVLSLTVPEDKEHAAINDIVRFRNQLCDKHGHFSGYITREGHGKYDIVNTPAARVPNDDAPSGQDAEEMTPSERRKADSFVRLRELQWIIENFVEDPDKRLEALALLKAIKDWIESKEADDNEDNDDDHVDHADD